MSRRIRIKEIRAEGLGPVGRFGLDAGDLNLIYGKNESGKTFIVEFIINCLFGKKDWGLRDSRGRGKVTVSGLEEKDVDFKPSGSKKLNRFLSRAIPGLPPALEKLMAVKGARPEIFLSSSSNHMELLKAFLSGKEILEEVKDKILVSIQKAVIEENTVKIESKPNIVKLREKAEEDLEKIEKLIDEVNGRYSLGPLFELKEKIKNLKEQKEHYLKAKKHLAFNLKKDLETLRGELEDFPSEEKIKELNARIITYRGLIQQKEDEEDEIKKLDDTLTRLPWLREAEKVYSELGRGVSEKLYRGAIVGCIILGAITIFFQPLVALIPLALGALIPFILPLQNRKDKEEAGEIKKKYREYFARELKDVSQMRAGINLLQGKEARRGALKSGLEKKNEKIGECRQDIEKIFFEICSSVPPEEEWNEKISFFEKERRKNNKKINDLQVKISSLNVEEAELSRRPAPVSYDREEEKEISRELEESRQILSRMQNSLDEIKIKIRNITSSEAISDEKLIDGLMKAREEALKEYRESTASIIGQRCLAGAVKKLSAVEEDKIRKALQKDRVKEPVKKLTSRYGSLNIKQDSLYLSDNFSEFSLNDLSTAAREQVFLGLRMGMAAEIMGKERLFFILDDAFQHSDWERRKEMGEKTAALSGDGWQIFYFTMDDHIRDLFKEQGSKIPGKFVYREI